MPGHQCLQPAHKPPSQRRHWALSCPPSNVGSTKTVVAAAPHLGERRAAQDGGRVAAVAPRVLHLQAAVAGGGHVL